MAILSHIDPISMGFVSLPFPYILLALLIFPKSIPMHHTVLEVTNVVLIPILKHAVSVWLVIRKVSKVPAFVRILNESFSIFMV